MVPVLDRTDDVRRIGSPELNFNLVSTVELVVDQDQVQPAPIWRRMLRGVEDRFPRQPDDGGVVRDELLKPGFVELRVRLKG